MTRLEQALVTISTFPFPYSVISPSLYPLLIFPPPPTVGRYPTYMRPPYIRCDGPCRETMNSLGYHVIIWDLNTDDYNNDSAQTIQNSRNNVLAAVEGSDPRVTSFMSIA